ncbi:response regulator transcription factor [Nocardioides sp. SR21]|uniref:response regulator transcription factor n=1 Tax=Nocardioides sp. SR21 TaxID=2919501 RepID=UPI001FAB04F6|nr:response regulator transcription factor [Nocardioides sp. SR21]
MSQPHASAVRVGIVDDHQLFAESLATTLRLERYDARRIVLPPDGGTTAQLVGAITRFHPDVLLLDLDLGRNGDGMRLIEPSVRAGAVVVIITGIGDRATWGECLERGAATVLLKTSSLEEVLATVRNSVRGLPVLSEDERASLIRQRQLRLHDQQVLNERLGRLTAREREILGHLLKGRTVYDIAMHGTVSEATVRTQVRSILAKLEVSSQIAAVGLAHQVGWSGPETETRTSGHQF